MADRLRVPQRRRALGDGRGPAHGAWANDERAAPRVLGRRASILRAASDALDERHARQQCRLRRAPGLDEVAGEPAVERRKMDMAITMVDNYLRLIRQFSQTTQFLLITHNKRTMEAADVLYGVTMQEPGVSKIVSVRLTDPEPVSPTEPIV